MKRALIVCCLALLVVPGLLGGSVQADTEDTVLQMDVQQMLRTVQDLEGVQAFSGWRSPATRGELSAALYMSGRVQAFSFLRENGMSTQIEEFAVPVSTETWQSTLEVEINGDMIEVPADTLRGYNENITLAQQFDTDGDINDSNANPIVVTSDTLALIDSPVELQALEPNSLQGQVVFTDYAIYDHYILGELEATSRANQLLNARPAGVVLLTRFTRSAEISHGTEVAGLNVFTFDMGDRGSLPPVLYARYEDFRDIGIGNMDEMLWLDGARLTLDVDVFVPGRSRNLHVTVHGQDSSRALIVGAHLDSANSPGALDNAAGAAILLEVLRVLDATATIPPIDVHLVWFGSEEIGLHGSSNFVLKHQTLLDRTVAMINIDNLTAPAFDIPGLNPHLTVMGYPPERVDLLVNPLMRAMSAASFGTAANNVPWPTHTLFADDAPFVGYRVPSVNLMWLDTQRMLGRPYVTHHAGFLHSPYDTSQRVVEHQDVLLQMAHLVMGMVLSTDGSENWYLTRPPDKRAVIVASYHQPATLVTAGMRDFLLLAAMRGYDVDVIPYGTALTDDGIRDAEFVMVMPPEDYALPGPTSETVVIPPSAATVLEQYVGTGGVLMLVNSGYVVGLNGNQTVVNEDSSAMNVLGQPFGIHFGNVTRQAKTVFTEPDTWLGQRVPTIALKQTTAVGIELTYGEPLAGVTSTTSILATVDYGAGHVVAIGEGTIFYGNYATESTPNIELWKALLDYVEACDTCP